MKKLLLLLPLFLFGCTSQKEYITNAEYTTNTEYNKNFTYQQVDSILNAEQIDWIDSMPLKGSKSKYYEYYYYKDSLVFRFFKDGDSIRVTKRINL